MKHERIELNPEIMGGKPVIRGTRVPVELILRKLGAGVFLPLWAYILAETIWVNNADDAWNGLGYPPKRIFATSRR